MGSALSAFATLCPRAIWLKVGWMADSRTPSPPLIDGVLQKVLAAFGVPLFAWLLGATWQSAGEYARNHPWQTVGLLVLYEVLLGIRWFFREIWKRLGNNLLDFCAERFKFLATSLVSGYARKYRNHVFYHCRDFDVKGLSTQGIYSLEMKRVFVELSVVPHQADTRGHDPVNAFPPDNLAERADIWTYLEREGNYAILGSPGSGKTTLLKHIALILANRHRKEAQKLPILIYLRNHARVIVENPDISLADIILASDVVKEQDLEPPEGWFQQQLRKGRCVILLDGLDEVGDGETRMKIVRWVERQVHRYANNRFCTTSRPLGYMDNPIPGVTTLRVLPLDHEQVGRFVSNWYLANEVMSHNKEDEGVRIEARKGATDLIRRIRGSDVLIALSVNPLLLTMIANVHRFRSQLPGRRVELYREICEVFLGKRQAIKGVQDQIDLTPDQKRFVLESLAYQLMCSGIREIAAADAALAIEASLRSVDVAISPSDFLTKVGSSSGLLVERERGWYAFAHKTFQEYLAAVHIRSKQLESELATRIEEEWWHETIRLYVAEADATPILEACLREELPSLRALTLALECIQDAQRVQQAWREKIESLIVDADPARQRIYGAAMLEIRQRKMVRLEDGNAVDEAYVTNVEYQLFLDEMRVANEYVPDHWTEPRFGNRDGLKPVILLRYSQVEAFCNWMTRKYGGQSWVYLIPSAAQLIEIQAAESRDREMQREIGCWSSDGFYGGEYNHTALRSTASSIWHLLVEAVHAIVFGKAIGVALKLETSLDYVLSGEATSRDEDRLERDVTRLVGESRNLPSPLDCARSLADALAANTALGANFEVADSRQVLERLVLYVNRIPEMARARERASGRKITLAREAASTRDRELARDREVSRAIKYGLDRDPVLEHALDLARGDFREREHHRAFANILDRALASALDLAAIYARDNELAPDLELVKSRAHARSHAFNLDGALGEDLAVAIDKGYDDTGDLVSLRKRAHNRANELVGRLSIVSGSDDVSRLRRCLSDEGDWGKDLKRACQFATGIEREFLFLKRVPTIILGGIVRATREGTTLGGLRLAKRVGPFY